MQPALWLTEEARLLEQSWLLEHTLKIEQIWQSGELENTLENGKTGELE